MHGFAWAVISDAGVSSRRTTRGKGEQHDAIAMPIPDIDGVYGEFAVLLLT